MKARSRRPKTANRPKRRRADAASRATLLPPDALRRFRAQIEVMRLPYLRVSVTPDCNAHCHFCHNEGAKWGRRGPCVRSARAQLSIDEYRYIARFFRSGFSRVKFTGGEPTLAKNLPSIVEVFADEGYACSLTTNGFILTNSLQRDLREAGLGRCNVSLHTTNAEEHAAAFGVPGQLDAVLENLAAVGRNFPGAAKVNFMALPGQNMPQQLVPMTELSAEVRIPISCLSLVSDWSPMSSDIIEYLDREVGISSIQSIAKDFCNRQVVEFKNGGSWEIDDFRQSVYRRVAFSNGVCRSCPKRSACTEGPYALRVLANGTLKPCLVRKDNEIRFRDGSFDLEE